MQDFRSPPAVSEAGAPATWLANLFAVGAALACFVALAGLFWRLWRWSRIAQPMPITLTPAPRTRLGVALRLALEVLVFRTLFRASPVTWLGCVLMHYGLLLVLLLHLRFLWPSTPLWLIPLISWSTAANLALVAGLALLVCRRVFVARIRYVSIPSDFAWLGLLLIIAASGIALKRTGAADPYAVGCFLRSALQFDVLPLAGCLVLWLHLFAVMALIVLFPFGKLLHAPGILFAPTLNSRAP